MANGSGPPRWAPSERPPNNHLPTLDPPFRSYDESLLSYFQYYRTIGPRASQPARTEGLPGHPVAARGSSSPLLNQFCAARPAARGGADQRSAFPCLRVACAQSVLRRSPRCAGRCRPPPGELARGRRSLYLSQCPRGRFLTASQKWPIRREYRGVPSANEHQARTCAPTDGRDGSPVES